MYDKQHDQTLQFPPGNISAVYLLHTNHFLLCIDYYIMLSLIRDEIFRSPICSWDVCQWLDALKRTRQHLAEKSANHPQLPNVDAIMTAYRSGNLGLKQGMATYCG
jgi:hypothetical protein